MVIREMAEDAWRQLKPGDDLIAWVMNLYRKQRGVPESPEHALPAFTRRWGYDHAEVEPWPYKDAQWIQMTSTGLWAAGMLRMVSGYKPSRGTVSRGPDSWISLDTYSVGIAHWWAKTAPKLFARIALEAPDLARWAWGSERAEKMEDKRWLPSQVKPRRRKNQKVKGHDSRLDWLCAGWWAIARHPRIVRIQCDHWLGNYPASARRHAEKLGWSDALRGSDGGLILAGLTRMHNSGAAYRRVRAGKKEARSRDPITILETAYHLPRDKGGYGKPGRWRKLISWDEFKGPAPQRLSAADALLMDVEPRRTDGSPVVFPDWLN